MERRELEIYTHVKNRSMINVFYQTKYMKKDKVWKESSLYEAMKKRSLITNFSIVYQIPVVILTAKGNSKIIASVKEKMKNDSIFERT